jgi:multidrug efflux system outer membrane protein
MIEMNAGKERLIVGLLVGFLVGFLIMAGAGCTVGPNYKKPPVAVPPEYRGAVAEQAGKSGVASFGDEKWWDAFQDQTLRDLIQTALKQNYDVKIAAARILEARAQLGITRADQLPTVAASASSVNERIPPSARIPAIETTANQVSVALAWEIDFWGKFRRATESARASLLAQEWAQRQVISSLVSDVASAYFQLRELDLELEISRQTLASRKDSLRLTQILADHGATSMLDVRQAEQLVYGAAAVIPDTEQRIEQQENFISTLLGNNPQTIARGRKLVDQPHALEVPAGLPSSLLERRPDIRQGTILSSDCIDGHRRLSKLRPFKPFRGACGPMDTWRSRSPAGVYRRQDQEPGQAGSGPDRRSHGVLSAYRAAGVSRRF